MHCTIRRVMWLLLATSVIAGADVFYVEEVVNSGVGAQKRGARRTVHEIHIKGARQRVSTDIEASKDVINTLQKQGAVLQGTKILLLDKGQLYDIDRATATYRQQKLPAAPPKPAVGTPAGTAKPTALAAKADPNREITVRTKALPDTTRIVGVLCRRVAVEMTAQHFKPGTKTVQRVNRYLYQAWMADGFPGYDELVAFRRRQEQQTALAPLIRGGLEQLTDLIEDPGLLEEELAVLKGFPMQSELKVYSTVGNAKEQELLRLSRRVLNLSHASLPDTLFRPAQGLKSVP